MTKKQRELKKNGSAELRQGSGDCYRCFETPDQIETVKNLESIMQQGFPWIDAPDERAREVAFLTAFPRTRFGQYQKNNLVRVLLAAERKIPVTATQLVEVTRRAAGLMTPPDMSWRSNPEAKEIPFIRMCCDWFSLFHFDEPWQPRTHSEFFAEVAQKLKYLETYQPTKSDFAIQALQESFVGLMQRKYDWSKNKYPTKGEVREMAKALLEREKKPIIKSGWTNMLREARLDWLSEGAAGRPKKQEVDENLKAKRIFVSETTKFVNTLGGDWISFLEKAKRGFGGKKLHEQDEIERLKNYGQVQFSSERE